MVLGVSISTRTLDLVIVHIIICLEDENVAYVIFILVRWHFWLELCYDGLDVFLEIERDHLIYLVDYYRLEVAHIDVASFEVIFDPPRSADKDVHFPFSE